MKHDDLESRLGAFEELLTQWAPRLDLVSPADLGRLRERHIDDSLKALAAVGSAPEGPCIDVGSGAGLPGIPLAAATDRLWRLLEPRRRRAAFLEECVRELALDNCEVIALSAAQALSRGLGAAHAIATARALAPPAEAAALCLPLVVPGGRVIVFVGSGAEIPAYAEEVGPGLITISKDAH